MAIAILASYGVPVSVGCGGKENYQEREAGFSEKKDIQENPSSKKVYVSYLDIMSPDFLDHPEIATDIRSLKIDALFLPIFGARHKEWIDNPNALSGLDKDDNPINSSPYTVYFNDSFYEDWEDIVKYFSRSCTSSNCSITKILESNGIGVIPYIALFYTAGAGGSEIKPFMCDTSKKDNGGNNCPLTNCPLECIGDIGDDTFSWTRSEEYFDGIYTTFENAANFVCTGENPTKTILIDGETYWGYAPEQNSWKYVPSGATFNDVLYYAFIKGQNISRVLAKTCPGISIFFYVPEIASNDTAIAFLMGLTLPEIGTEIKYNIHKVHFLESPYYRISNNTSIYDLIRGEYKNSWGRVGEISSEYGINISDESYQLLLQRKMITPWTTVMNEKLYTGTCYDGSTGKLKDDYFTDTRQKLFRTRYLPWFDIKDSFFSDEMNLLKSLTDILVIYPGSRQFLCFNGSESCPDIYEDFWEEYLTWDKDMDTPLNPKDGSGTCIQPITSHFSAETLQSRANNLASIIKDFKEPIPQTIYPNTGSKNGPHFLPLEKNNNTDKTSWRADDVEILKMGSSWKFIKNTYVKNPKYYFMSTGIAGVTESERELKLITWNTDVNLWDKSRFIDDFDVNIWILAYFGRANRIRINFEGSDLLFNVKNKSTVNASEYKGWYWVKLGRHYLESSRNQFKFISRANTSSSIKFADIKFIKNKNGEPYKITWINSELQEWVHGDGWKRNKTGSLTFNFDNISDQNLPFTTEIISLPGRQKTAPDSASYHNICLHILVPDGKIAKIKYQYPGFGNENKPVLSAENSGWYKLDANSTPWDANQNKDPAGKTILKLYQWKLKIEPQKDTCIFTIDKIKMIPNNDSPNACEN